MLHLQMGYDARAPNYTQEVSARPDKIHQIDITNKFYFENLRQFLSNRQIEYLDVGCADGVRTKYFFDKLNDFCTVVRLEGLDYSRELVKLAQSVLGKENVVWGDITDLSYDANFYLITCMYSVLGHLPEDMIQTAFDNLWASLRDGGHLCVDVIAKDPQFLERYGYDRATENSGDYLAYFVSVDGKPLTNVDGKPIVFTQRMSTPAEMRRYARRAGFGIVAEKEVTAIESGVDEMEYALVLQK